MGWEIAVNRDVRDATIVTGSIDLRGRNWGKSNCASWTLLENVSTKTGVPSLLQTAVLLKRVDVNPFKCVFKIDAIVDFKSTLERVFGGTGRGPKDDPVLFDPKMEPTHNLHEYDVDDLGASDLVSTHEVKLPTVVNGNPSQDVE